MTLRQTACDVFDELVAALPEARASLRRVGYGANAVYEDLVLYKLHRMQAQLHTVCITSDDACEAVGVRASKLDHATRESFLWLLDSLNDFMLADYVRLASKIHKPHLPPKTWKGWKPAQQTRRGVIVADPDDAFNRAYGEKQDDRMQAKKRDPSTVLRGVVGSTPPPPTTTLGAGSRQPFHPQSLSVKVSSTLQKVTAQRSLTAEGSAMVRREPKKAAKKTVYIRERPIDRLFAQFDNLEEKSRTGWLAGQQPDVVNKAAGTTSGGKTSPEPSEALSLALESKSTSKSAFCRVRDDASEDNSAGVTQKGVTFQDTAADARTEEITDSGPTLPGTMLAAAGTTNDAVRGSISSVSPSEFRGAIDVSSDGSDIHGISGDITQGSSTHSHTQDFLPTPSPLPALDDAESEIDEDEAEDSAVHRAYHETTFVLRIPKSATVWHQLWNSSIELQHCQLGSKGIRAVAGALRCKSARCSYLGLMGTGMDSVALQEVLDAISSNHGLGLTQLNLGCNELGVSGGEVLAAFFEQANGIRNEDKSLNAGTVADVERTTSVAAPRAQRGSHLQAISVHDCSLTDSTLATIIRSLEHHPSMSAIDLSRNGGAHQAATALGSLLRSKHGCIVCVDFSWNRMTAANIRNIAEALKINTMLQELDLSWNGLGSEGVAALGEALGQNSTLRQLHVGSCGAGPSAASRLARGLQDNSGSLEVLTLQNNPLGQKGGEMVAAVVNAKPPDSMPSVNLIGCHFHLNAESETSVRHGKQGESDVESNFNISVKGDLIGLSEDMLMRPIPDDDTFKSHISKLKGASVTDRERLNMLRQMLKEVRYTSRQCKEALAIFQEPGESRARCAVLMLPHIPQTFWSVVNSLLSREEVKELHSRLARVKGI